MNHHFADEHGRDGGESASHGSSERMMVTIGGGLLTLMALRRGGLVASVAAVAGSMMLVAGLGRPATRSSGSQQTASGRRRGTSGHIRDQSRQDGGMDQSRGMDQSKGTATFSRRARQSIVIGVPKQKAYEFWRDASNLSRFMSQIDRIVVVDPKLARWFVKVPSGEPIELDVRVTEDRPGDRIAWSTDEGAPMQAEGSVDFREISPTSTEVTIGLSYATGSGEAGRRLAGSIADLPARASEDLNKLKTTLESMGEGNKPSPGEAARSF